MSDSVWKKEISFSRKKPQQDAAPEASAEPVETAPVEPKQSFWKKDLSLSHKAPQQDAAPEASMEPVVTAPADAKPSVWKKEISFGRKPKEAAPPPPAAEPTSLPQPRESVLRKEISFGRKAKEPAAAQVEASAAPEPKQSMWKKEISFSRKTHDKEVERIAEDAAQAVAPSFAPPLGPPPDVPPTAVAEAAVAAMPAVDEPSAPSTPAETFPLAAVPAFEPLPSTFEPPPAVAPAPAAVEPAPAAVEPVPAAVEPPPPVDEPPHPAEEPLPFVPVPLQIAPEQAEPVPVEPVPVEPVEPVAPSVPFAPVSFELPPSVPFVPAEPEPVASAPAVPVPELPLDAVAAVEPEPPLTSAPPPLSAPSPAVVAASTDAPEAAPPPPLADVFAFPEASSAPPVELVQPESIQLTPIPPPIQLAPEPVDLPPLAEQPVDPWLAAAELPPAPADPLPVAVHPPVPAAELAPIVEPKTPFWKKELSFSRKPKPAFEPQPVAAAPADDLAASGPWWKKELSFSRKPKANLEPQPPAAAPTDALAASGPWWKKELSFSRTPKAAAAVAPAVVDAAASEAKTPWWKKELGGKKGGTAPAAAVQAPTDVAAAPKAPFWKRQLSVATPKLPKGGANARGRKGPKGAKRLVGLKIGASQLAAARVSNNGVAELEQVARQDLPIGIVVGGELRDPDALTEALKAFFAKNKLPKKGVRLGIANNRIGVRIFDIVGVDEAKQLANAIHFRAQEALPIPLDEAVLDYHVLDESVDEEGRNVKRVLLVVAYKELIDRYVGACRKAGITLAGIDLEAFALLRSLSPPTDGGSAALVAVAIGYDRSTFAVSDGRVCEFTRVLDWGGWSLNVALARAFDTAPSEVEALKCGLSLDGTVAPDGLSPEQTALAVDTVQRQVQSFARELVSSLQFYQNQPGSLGIGEIVITGGTAALPGLAEELERLIGVRVRLGNPLARLKVAKRVTAPADHLGSLAVAIGLGIED